MITDPDEIYGSIIPAWRGPEQTWKPRHRAAFFEDDLESIPPDPPSDSCFSLRWRAA